MRTIHDIGRRDFLKLTGKAAVLASLGVAGLRKLGLSEVQAATTVQDGWIPTCCNMCGGTTGILAHVVNNRVIKLEPNSANPVGVCNISTDFTALKSTGARMCS